MTKKQATRLLYDWGFWARPKQMAPKGKWSGWLYLAGRGSGKTRSGAEWIRQRVESGKAKRIALVGETAGDVRDVMVLGDSGILATSPPWNKPLWSPANRRITWPNGAYAITFSGEDPDQLRGPQFDTAWLDELAKYYNPDEVWSNLEFGLRLGNDPRFMVTTTPRPIKIVKDMLKDPDVVVTRGSSYENLSNLAPSYIKRVIKKYEGTRLGRQELHAEVLEDVQGALWSTSLIEQNRLPKAPDDLLRVVVALDPATKSEEGSNETGIIVAGMDASGIAYIMRDASGMMTPDAWARKAINLQKVLQADRVVGEVNQGGEMVEHTLRTVDMNVPYKAVHASRGKVARAEPVAALQEQGKIKFCGLFAELEDQLVSLTPEGYIGEGSPDRADALVWAITELLLGGSMSSSDPDDYADTRAK